MKKLFLLFFAGAITSSIIAQSCIADFTFSPGTNNGDIDFTNTSTAVSSSPWFSWSFGDGTSTNQESPSHTYTEDGIYNVSLMLMDSANNCYDQISKTVEITGLNQCTADFITTITSAANGEVSFQNTSTSINGSFQGTYIWDFGDGALSTAEHPIHTYANSGLYNVCLTIEDNLNNCSHTECKVISLQGVTSSSNCTAQYYWYQDTTGANSVWIYNYSLGSGLSYHWDFGDGNTSAQMYPSHTYAQDGTYQVCLTIENGNGCFDTYCDNVYVTTKSQGFTLHVIGETSNIEEVQEVSITNLFPNPVQENATIAINATSAQSISLNIVGITGKVLNSTNHVLSSGNNTIEMNISNLSQGIYFAQIVSENGMTQTLQFVKR